MDVGQIVVVSDHEKANKRVSGFPIRDRHTSANTNAQKNKTSENVLSLDESLLRVLAVPNTFLPLGPNFIANTHFPKGFVHLKRFGVLRMEMTGTVRVMFSVCWGGGTLVSLTS